MECDDNPNILINDALKKIIKLARKSDILYVKLIFHNGRAYDNILIS